jgi:mono/diheme cytochrome c family protein
MKALRALLMLAGVLAIAAAVAAAVLALRLRERGISARDEPSAVEAAVARKLRSWAVPAVLRGARNPVAASPQALARARAHFADHCASCHGNDGRGRTDLGQSLYPKAPDMTLPATSGLSDGELFAIIENGVRLTGMPAWGQPGPEDDEETWELVHFVRHLPKLTAEELAEMESLNPRSPKQLEEEEAIRRFLAGEDPPAQAPSAKHH